MDVLKAMTVFIEVAKQQGFAPAARALNLSTSAVSRHVAELEDWLGTKLLQRTTRRLHVTAHGNAYLERCKQVVTEITAIKQIAANDQEEPQGGLRVTAPVFIANHFVSDLLPVFLNRYPKINLELMVMDRQVNLVEEGFDVALRAGELDDSSLVARKLIDIRLTMVATPAYLEQHGKPNSITDLREHNCLVDTTPGYADQWPIYDEKIRRNFQAAGNVRINNGEMIRSMAISGVGIALLPAFYVRDEILDGTLVPMLESNIRYSAGLYTVYPSNRHLAVNVRSFIDFIIEYIDLLKQQYD